MIPLGQIFAADKAVEKKEVVRTDDEELIYLNRQIENLKELKEYYVDKANRAQSRGRRLTFQNDSLRTEARQQLLQAEEYKKIADQIGKEIDILEGQREKLLQKMGRSNLNDPCQ